MKLEIKSYKQLSLDEFHDLIQLRIQVFVIEQDCSYQEVDGKDKLADHLLAVQGGQMMATLRILPPGIAYTEWAIGRVVVAEEGRGTGLGNEIMELAIQHIDQLHGGLAPIKLSAQEHLRAYYQRHGFEQSGEGYLEDGIPHIPMGRGIER